MKILHLVVTKNWFDMIVSGEKTEEYREIKPYWIKRLYAWNNAYDEPRDFNAIQIKNGYSKNSPRLLVEWKGMETGIPVKGWCEKSDENKELFKIKLGRILKTDNL